MIHEELLKKEERAVYTLRALYRRYGYLPFRMSRFEEYDLYVRNKDFLISDSVITFTDTNGRLLALKPDVTLSIIKNTIDTPGCKQKLSYNENVYRVSGRTRQFKEIMQTGLECIGDIDLYDVFEVVSLAAASLAAVSPDFVLDLSHMGIFSAVLDQASADPDFRREIAALIAGRNRHESEALCRRYGVPAAAAERLCALTDLYGEPEAVLTRLAPLCTEGRAKEAYDTLAALWALLSGTTYADRIRIDFSVLNDMNYYNGILFRGFLNGIAEGVLSGGEYGMLMQRMGKRSNAIGFALYLDQLEERGDRGEAPDVDVLLLYDAATAPAVLIKRKDALLAEGKSVSAQRAIPEGLRYGMLLDIRGKEEGK